MMQAMVNIDNITLSSKKCVTVLYNTGSAPQVHQYVVDGDDAEYILLAQAIDRFCQIQKQQAAIEQAKAQLEQQQAKEREEIPIDDNA